MIGKEYRDNENNVEAETAGCAANTAGPADTGLVDRG